MGIGFLGYGLEREVDEREREREREIIRIGSFRFLSFIFLIGSVVN